MRPSQLPRPPGSAASSLLAAAASDRPEVKLRHVREGLATLTSGDEGQVRMLLLRQRYLAHVALRQFRRALGDALAMVATGEHPDLAYHDAARAHAVLGEYESAIGMQRLAMRCSHPDRRSFHGFCLATLQHFGGHPEDALVTLKRALRSATRDRVLLVSQAVYIRLDAGIPVRNVARVLGHLRASKHYKGYGRFLAGMIAYHQGDAPKAIRDLEAFLLRHEGADVARVITLREELRRARLALGSLRAV